MDTATARQTERDLVRDLARKVAEIAAQPEEAEKVRLWRVCNDLKPERPMVFLNPQNGWGELQQAWLRCECEDGFLRGIENSLRMTLLRYEHIPDDVPVLGNFDIGVHYSGAGYGDYGVEMLATHSGVDRGAYHIEPSIQSEADMEKLHFRPVQIDHESTNRSVERVSEVIGDILNVRKRGRSGWRYGLSRVLIHMRGLDNMMFDMFERPELLHGLMAFLRDDYMRELDLFEKEEAMSVNNEPLDNLGSGGYGPVSDLPGPDFDPEHVRAHNCQCWGESQETVGFGPAQFDEFVLQYQLPLLSRFGLVDYGCCEPLDQKIDLLIEKVPNLRWVAVSPWSNREMNAEKIGDRYVYVYKPNPSRICSPQADWKAAEGDVRETIEIARGCPMHIVMKDTSTFCGEPGRVTRWAEMARRICIESAS